MKKNKKNDPELERVKKAFDDNSEELFRLANLYNHCRAFAELTRAQVDKIANEVLAEIPIYNDLEVRHNRGDRERITEWNNSYLCEDQEAMTRIFKLIDERERAAGIKPAEIEFDFCPALVAEEELRKVEHLILDITLPIFKITFDGLFSKGDGIATYKKFVEYSVRAIVNNPNFVPENWAKEALENRR